MLFEITELTMLPCMVIRNVHQQDTEAFERTVWFGLLSRIVTVNTHSFSFNPIVVDNNKQHQGKKKKNRHSTHAKRFFFGNLLMRNVLCLHLKIFECDAVPFSVIMHNQKLMTNCTLQSSYLWDVDFSIYQYI